MEFKISQKSQDKLNKLILELGATKYMTEADKLLYEETQHHSKELKRIERIKYKSTHGYFKSADELINWVLAGNKIHCDDLLLHTPDYIYLNPNDSNEVIHYSLQYNDVDCPVGMGNHYMNWTEFVEWVNTLGSPDYLEDGFIPFWHK